MDGVCRYAGVLSSAVKFACGVGCGSLGIREAGCSERLLSAACSVRFADGDVSLAMLVGSVLRFGAVSCWVPVGGGLTDDTMLSDPIGVGPNAVASMTIRAYTGAESASTQVLAAAMSVYTLFSSLSRRDSANPDGGTISPASGTGGNAHAGQPSGTSSGPSGRYAARPEITRKQTYPWYTVVLSL